MVILVTHPGPVIQLMPNGAKHWCFTINNYDEAIQLHLRSIVPRVALYLVFGREVGQSGTPHLQGYAQFSTRRSLAFVKRNLSAQGHYEIARGTPQEASSYCKKDDDFEEFGELQPGQGHRTDLARVAQLVKDGSSTRQIADEHPEAVIRYANGIGKLRLLCRPPTRETPPLIQVFWGRTGLGKTRRVHDLESVEELWIHPGGPWFDGYDAHPAVLFDDFDGGWFKLGYLLKLLDRYNFQVPIKGGHIWWAPLRIYITSNIDPKLWYQGAQDAQANALQRRLREFGKVIHFDAIQMPNQ